MNNKSFHSIAIYDLIGGRRGKYALINFNLLLHMYTLIMYLCMSSIFAQLITTKSTLVTTWLQFEYYWNV